MGNDFKQYIKGKIKDEISSWDAPDIYAVYIGVSRNNRCDEPLGLPFIFVIGYGSGSKKDWHLACSSEYERDLIENEEEKQALIQWLEGLGTENIGVEDEDAMYDENMLYIGKGPAGMYETLDMLAGIVRELFSESFFEEKFGENIPVIFDDYEITWYCIEATKKANPEGLANGYLRKYGIIGKKALGVLSKVVMFVGSLIVIWIYLPCTLFLSVVTLIAGGVGFPLTFGGVLKILIVLAVFAVRNAKIIRLKKTVAENFTDKKKEIAKQNIRLFLLAILDIALACVCLFVFPNRLGALVFLVCVLVYALIDQIRMKKARKDLVNTRRDDIMKMISDSHKPDEK